MTRAKDVKALVSSATNVQALRRGVSRTPPKFYTPYGTKAFFFMSKDLRWWFEPRIYHRSENLIGAKEVKALDSSATNVQALRKGVSRTLPK